MPVKGLLEITTRIIGIVILPLYMTKYFKSHIAMIAAHYRVDISFIIKKRNRRNILHFRM
jgi:hypothetical protein